MSREKFEAWFSEVENFATRGERLKDESFGYAMYQAFIAGRESMRDEAIDKLGDFEAVKCAQIVAGIEP